MSSRSQRASTITLIHIEDHPDWQRAVEELVRSVSDLQSLKYVAHEGAEALRTIKTGRRYLVVMDLHLGHPRAYDGFLWLLDEFAVFREKNPLVEVLVLSGNLNEAVSSALVRRGVPTEHVFEKGTFDGSRFIEAVLAAHNRLRVQTSRHPDLVTPSRKKAGVPPSERLFVDDIDSFANVRKVTPTDVSDVLDRGYLDISEDSVQTALEDILAVPVHKLDWGGESNDLFTGNIVINGSRVDAAFLLKGNGLRKRAMELRDCGKNGDQILRLVDSPAALFVVQFVGIVSENVIRDLAGKVAHLRGQKKNARYCIIDGQDTARLLRAYGKL